MNTPFNPVIQLVEKSSLSAINLQDIEFGKQMTDHMFVAQYENGQWHSPSIMPLQKLHLHPGILGLHYGQTVFEGMKAFRQSADSVALFRPRDHAARFNKSLERMSMPKLPEEWFVSGIELLLQFDHQWVPALPGYSLYIRPFAFASEAKLGMKVSDQYLFVVIASPVGPYYEKPLRVKVEREFSRAAQDGTGYAKCGGNYGGSFYPMQKARAQGFDQIIWTDSKEHKYIDEAGTMNLMFVWDGKLVTPAINPAILSGITRDSILKLASHMGVETEERKISIEAVKDALSKGLISEAFGTGTAAVVSPLAHIDIEGEGFDLPELKEDSLANRVKQELAAIRYGQSEDIFSWNSLITMPEMSDKL